MVPRPPRAARRRARLCLTPASAGPGGAGAAGGSPGARAFSDQIWSRACSSSGRACAWPTAANARPSAAAGKGRWTSARRTCATRRPAGTSAPGRRWSSTSPRVWAAATTTGATRAACWRRTSPWTRSCWRRAPRQPPPARGQKDRGALPAAPPNSYGGAKLVGEKAVESVAAAETGSLRAALLRLENVYGPGQDIDFERGSLLPVLVRRALEYPQTPFQVRGTGRETRCYCYVSDAVEACLRAVEALADRRVVGPLNVSGDERVSVGQLAEEVVRLSGKDIRVEWIPVETPLWGQVVDCRRAQAELSGWCAAVSLTEGIRRLFADVAARLEAGERQPVGGGRVAGPRHGHRLPRARAPPADPAGPADPQARLGAAALQAPAGRRR